MKANRIYPPEKYCFTGNVTTGIVIYVGTLIFWVNKKKVLLVLEGPHARKPVQCQISILQISVLNHCLNGCTFGHCYHY